MRLKKNKKNTYKRVSQRNHFLFNIEIENKDDRPMQSGRLAC